MLTECFNTFVGIGSRSHDFNGEPNISILIQSSVAHSKTCILDLIPGVCTDGTSSTLFSNLVSIYPQNISRYGHMM